MNRETKNAPHVLDLLFGQSRPILALSLLLSQDQHDSSRVYRFLGFLWDDVFEQVDFEGVVFDG